MVVSCSLTPPIYCFDPIKTNEKQEAGLKRRARDELWVDLCYFGYSNFIDFATLSTGIYKLTSN
jgi:hypothetical protein